MHVLSPREIFIVIPVSFFEHVEIARLFISNHWHRKTRLHGCWLWVSV